MTVLNMIQPSKLLFMLCLLFNSGPVQVFNMGEAQADEITLAVASNFAVPVKKIITDFEQSTPHKVRLILGSSGKLFAQIIHGAPYDIFLSADQTKPARLETDGRAIERFTYAIGGLALWSSQANYILAGADILKAGKFRKIALANPKLAPYGVAARDTLQALDLYEALSKKFITGENIAQTYHFISSGNAELGFIALSQLRSMAQLQSITANNGSFWIIPEELYTPIAQDAVLLKKAAHNPAALAFMAYLRSEGAKNILLRYGYKIPKEAS